MGLPSGGGSGRPVGMLSLAPSICGIPSGVEGVVSGERAMHLSPGVEGVVSGERAMHLSLLAGPRLAGRDQLLLSMLLSHCV